jgi:hypothetical protein
MEIKGDLKENLSSDGEDSEDNTENETEIDDKFSSFRIENNENKPFRDYWHKKHTYKKSAYVLAIISTLKFLKYGANKLTNGVYMIKKDYDGTPDKETCALLGVPVKLITDFLIEDSELVISLKKSIELSYIDDIEEITTKYISKALHKFLPYFKSCNPLDLVLLNIEPRGFGRYARKYPTPRVTIPGGKMESDDLFNFESCGFREFKEETGLDITCCHEKISREKIRSSKRFTHLSSFQKRLKVLPYKKQQELLTKFESMYYLVKIK